MKNRIKQLREERNMTQVRLSIELGVSQETISAYEIGKHNPSMTSLLKMSKLFNASFDYIMGVSDVKKVITEDILSNDEVGLLSLYRHLNDNQKEKTLAFMQGLYNA